MSEHIIPARLYWTIWAVLIVLTFVTAGVATLDLGPFNSIVALVIVASIFWLSIMLLFSLTDYGVRAIGS
jgi:hypothetical protein